MPPPTWQQLKIWASYSKIRTSELEVDLLRREVHREARDPRAAHLRDPPLDGQPGRLALRVERREVLHVDVARLQEVGRHGDAEQAPLELVVGLVGALAALAAVAVDRERAGAGHAAVDGAVALRRVPDVDAAAADARRSGRRGRGSAPATGGRRARRAPGRCGSRRGRCRCTQPFGATTSPCDSPLVASPVSTAPPLTSARAAVARVDRRLAVAAHEARSPTGSRRCRCVRSGASDQLAAVRPMPV